MVIGVKAGGWGKVPRAGARQRFSTSLPQTMYLRSKCSTQPERKEEGRQRPPRQKQQVQRSERTVHVLAGKGRDRGASGSAQLKRPHTRRAGRRSARTHMSDGERSVSGSMGWSMGVSMSVEFERRGGARGGSQRLPLGPVRARARRTDPRQRTAWPCLGWRLGRQSCRTRRLSVAQRKGRQRVASRGRQEEQAPVAGANAQPPSLPHTHLARRSCGRPRRQTPGP